MLPAPRVAGKQNSSAGFLLGGKRLGEYLGKVIHIFESSDVIILSERYQSAEKIRKMRIADQPLRTVFERLIRPIIQLTDFFAHPPVLIQAELIYIFFTHIQLPQAEL
jgi:hypothetical protein